MQAVHLSDVCINKDKNSFNSFLSRLLKLKDLEIFVAKQGFMYSSLLSRLQA